MKTALPFEQLAVPGSPTRQDIEYFQQIARLGSEVAFVDGANNSRHEGKITSITERVVVVDCHPHGRKTVKWCNLRRVTNWPPKRPPYRDEFAKKFSELVLEVGAHMIPLDVEVVKDRFARIGVCDKRLGDYVTDPGGIVLVKFPTKWEGTPPFHRFMTELRRMSHSMIECKSMLISACTFDVWGRYIKVVHAAGNSTLMVSF